MDGLNSVKNSLSKGVLPGGGVSYLYASLMLNQFKLKHIDENYGVRIFQNAIQKCFDSIISNSGINPKIIKEKLLKKEDWSYVYNVQTGKMENFIDSGIIDSYHNLSTSLYDTCSISTYLLTTDCIVSLKEIYKPKGIKNYKHLAEM